MTLKIRNNRIADFSIADKSTVELFVGLKNKFFRAAVRDLPELAIDNLRNRFLAKELSPVTSFPGIPDALFAEARDMSEARYRPKNEKYFSSAEIFRFAFDNLKFFHENGVAIDADIIFRLGASWRDGRERVYGVATKEHWLSQIGLEKNIDVKANDTLVLERCAAGTHHPVFSESDFLFAKQCATISQDRKFRAPIFFTPHATYKALSFLMFRLSGTAIDNKESVYTRHVLGEKIWNDNLSLHSDPSRIEFGAPIFDANLKSVRKIKCIENGTWIDLPTLSNHSACEANHSAVLYPHLFGANKDKKNWSDVILNQPRCVVVTDIREMNENSSKLRLIFFEHGTAAGKARGTGSSPFDLFRKAQTYATGETLKQCVLEAIACDDTFIQNFC